MRVCLQVQQELIFSVPFDEDDFTSGSGAGSIKVDGIIKGIKVFRESLFVFCEDSIFKITGSSLSDFAVVPVTRKIGCVDGFSIQEISGDIVFLAPDGLRTVAGTEKIGDVELGTVSKLSTAALGQHHYGPHLVAGHQR